MSLNVLRTAGEAAAEADAEADAFYGVYGYGGLGGPGQTQNFLSRSRDLFTASQSRSRVLRHQTETRRQLPATSELSSFLKTRHRLSRL